MIYFFFILLCIAVINLYIHDRKSDRHFPAIISVISLVGLAIALLLH